MKLVKDFTDRHYKLTGFFAGILLIFIDLIVNNIRTSYYDAQGYEIMADHLIKENFFLFDFNVRGGVEAYLFSVRAYGWPLIIALFKILGLNTQLGYWFFWSVFIAGGMAYALPELIETIFQKHITWFIRILPIALTIIFWNGLIIYALSDIPAVVIVTLGLLVLSRISDHNKFQINLMMSCLCGFFCGLAYYIRSGCKPIILIAVFIIFIYKFKKAISKKIISVIIMCLGMGLSMIPQVLINISCNHTISYEVPIFFTTKFAEGEYYLGFKLLRYETNITGLHPDLALGSYDSVIDNILKAEDISSNEVDLETIVGLGIKYPLEFLGMYATKFANYLDPRYGNSLYITNLNSRQYGIMIFNYLLWFLAFFGIGTELSSPEDGERTQWENLLYFIKNYFLYIFAFILPALIHLLGTQVEVRYFYPCYILMYTYLAMLCPWKQMYKFFRKRWVTTLIICFAFFGCLNAIWNFTFENFSYADLLLKDSQNISIENIESDG